MKRFFLTLVFCLSILTLPALAQETQVPAEGVPTLSSLEVALWPEYDRPALLVIYRGLFAPDTALPTPVEIRIPARAGEPTAVAYVGDDGQRYNQEHTTRVDGDWLVVSFSLPTLGFQLEYYDTLPVDSTNQREYTYTYAADYPIAALDLEFQVPPTAEAFTVNPPADSVVTEADGLTYHLVQAESVDLGETMSWVFAYQKEDSSLTVEGFVQPETPVPAAGAAAGGSDSSAVLIFLIAFVGLIGVGAGAFWLGRRAQSIAEASSPPPKRQKRRGSGRGPQPQPLRFSPADGEEMLFCYKCGNQLRSDADFCHKCGTSVRRT